METERINTINTTIYKSHQILPLSPPVIAIDDPFCCGYFSRCPYMGKVGEAEVGSWDVYPLDRITSK